MIIVQIDPRYLELSFDSVGIRNSQKRLESLIAETAVEPIIEFETELRNDFDLVETIIRHRIAHVIVHWSKNKHDPAVARLDNRMSEITNASKTDITLSEFYIAEVKSALHSLAPTLELNVPADYEPPLDIIADALIQTGHQSEPGTEQSEDDHAPINDDAYSVDLATESKSINDQPSVDVDQIKEGVQFEELEQLIVAEEVPEKMKEHVEQELAIVNLNQNQIIEVKKTSIQDSVLPITVEEAWYLIYGLIGYRGEYIQQTMLPRWQQNPVDFDKDRRFLYKTFIDTLRNAGGVQMIAGHYKFSDREMTIDELWSFYYSDLAQNVAPHLASATLHNNANDPWHKKFWQSAQKRIGNISLVWLIALAIALVLDALTTYISLDQTPMEGPMVMMFTVLITALFQIADQLVISYRKREFEAEAMSAKYRAYYEGLTQEVSKLAITSESYVEFSMRKSKAHADWKAAEDNRKMAQRGRFWTARIADINVVVTAYGFTYMFLNSREPMVAVVEQFEAIFVRNDLKSVDPWVFMMVALAITVSFVVNTAQRTEILGWSMQRLKQEA